jgi:hypothetical protein
MAVKSLLRIRSRLSVVIRRSLEKPRKQAIARLQATAKSYAFPGDDNTWVNSAVNTRVFGIRITPPAGGRQSSSRKMAFTVDISIGGVLMSYACMRSYWI